MANAKVSDNPINSAYLFVVGKGDGYLLRLMDDQHKDKPHIVGCAVVAPWTQPRRWHETGSLIPSYTGGEEPAFPLEDAHFDYLSAQEAKLHLEILYAQNLPEEKSAFLAVAREAHTAARLKCLTDEQDALMKQRGASNLAELLEMVDPASEEGSRLDRINKGIEAAVASYAPTRNG